MVFNLSRACVLQVADQRPTKLPVTFALMTLLLREHNRCCDEMAPEWDPENDEVDGRPAWVGTHPKYVGLVKHFFFPKTRTENVRLHKRAWRGRRYRHVVLLGACGRCETMRESQETRPGSRQSVRVFFSSVQGLKRGNLALKSISLANSGDEAKASATTEGGQA